MKQKFKLISAVMLSGIAMIAIFSMQPVTGSSIKGEVRNQEIAGKLSMADRQAFTDSCLSVMNARPAYIGAPFGYINKIGRQNFSSHAGNNTFNGSHSPGTKNVFWCSASGRINSTGANKLFIGSRSAHSHSLRVL